MVFKELLKKVSSDSISSYLHERDWSVLPFVKHFKHLVSFEATMYVQLML